MTQDEIQFVYCIHFFGGTWPNWKICTSDISPGHVFIQKAAGWRTGKKCIWMVVVSMWVNYGFQNCMILGNPHTLSTFPLLKGGGGFFRIKVWPLMKWVTHLPSCQCSKDIAVSLVLWVLDGQYVIFWGLAVVLCQFKLEPSLSVRSRRTALEFRCQ